MREITVRALVKGGLSMRVTRKIVLEALAYSGKRIAQTSLAVVYGGDGLMKKLNSEWRGKNTTTDVLSFLYESGTALSGDIIISVPQASRQARACGQEVKKELTELLIHGMLHLLGYDHQKPRDAVRMRRSAELIYRRVRGRAKSVTGRTGIRKK